MKLNAWMFALIGVLLLAGGFAQGANATGTTSGVLGLKYGLMACRMDAVVSLIDYAENNTNLTSNGLGQTISSDLVSLKAFADSGDRAGFNSFVIGNLKNDLKDAVLFLKDARREIRKGAKGASGDNYFVGTVKSRADCLQQAALSFAQGQQDEMGARVANMNATIARLKNKSIDTSKMEIVEQQAEANLAKLNAAIAAGNATDLTEAVKAIREEHLHIWARFEIAKAEAITGAITTEAASKGKGSTIEEVNALLSDASSKVAEGRPYDPGEFEKVKSDLQQANEKLRNLLKDLRGA